MDSDSLEVEHRGTFFTAADKATQGSGYWGWLFV